MSRRQPPSDEALRRWAVLLDSAFRVPGTRIRFGLDALVGLVPVLGDLASPLFTVALLVEGTRRGLPAIVQARMVLNAAIDMLLGLVPVLGDTADVFWRANLRNLGLLERHARPGVRPQASDYLFVFLCIGAVAVIGAIPILLLIWLITTIPPL